MGSARTGHHDGLVSALRRARLHHNWTLERAVQEIGAHPDGPSGATPSLLSAWERGNVVTSARYRSVLCAIYDESPEILFAHQDHNLWDLPLTNTAPAPSRQQPRLLRSYAVLSEAMQHVVESAQERLVVTGSRSRDAAYLAAIENVLYERPTLIHYRILFGPPRHEILQKHLRSLLTLRDPSDRSYGWKTLHIGLFAESERPERFFVASEHAAVVTLPSLTAAEMFDTGISLTGPDATALVQHAIQLYAAAVPVETLDAMSEIAIE